MVRALQDAVENWSGSVGAELAITAFMDALRETSDQDGSRWVSLDYLLKPFVLHPASGVDFGTEGFYRYTELELPPGSALEDNFKQIRDEIG